MASPTPSGFPNLPVIFDVSNSTMGTPVYGIPYWRKQIAYIREHGTIERLVIPPSLTKSLNLPWLKNDATLTWKTAPGGPRPVRVLFIGSKDVMGQIIGEPFKDYDPKEFPNRNVWLEPKDFAEFDVAHPQKQENEDA